MAKKPMHWADQTAKAIINKKGNKKTYIVATGVTPSGTLHIGNFRELITGDFIKKALINQGKKAIHYHYWDDYDVFRKIPKNMPKQDILKKHLRKALIYVPDVFGDSKNYPEHNEKEVEKTIPTVDVNPDIIRNSELYLKSVYAEEIKTALENTDKLKEIFNKYRKEELERNWLPISVYCEKCHLEAEKISYEDKYSISYECSCGKKDTIDFRKKGLVKLKWRVQWPAWWHLKKVDFESAGKDHFASGGSIDTAKEIAKEIYKLDPPLGFGFGWIGIKEGKQFSSSTGVITTLKDVLDIYEPSIVRWIFAGSRPTTEFSISFDLDVLSIYEEFDRCERIYFKNEKVDEKEYEKQKRIYELSKIKIPKKLPYQPSFRHLTNVLQIYDKDLKKTTEAFKEFLKTKEDKDKFEIRLKCALNWLENYAPEDFKFTIQEKLSKDIKLDKKQKQALNKVAGLLSKTKTDKELHEEFYKICQELELNVGDFFKGAYLVLINKEKGPRLASFILTIGKSKVKKLFEKV